MIAGIRMGKEEVSWETALQFGGIFQEVLGDRQLLVDCQGDWACWLGPAGWHPRDHGTELLETLMWVQCPPGSEWLFRPDGIYGAPHSTHPEVPAGEE